MVCVCKGTTVIWSLDRIYRPALARSIRLSSIDILSEGLILNLLIFNARSGPGMNMIFFAFPDERQKDSS